MTVSGLLNSIDAKEIAEWKAYDRIEPFGEERQDLRAALICCTLANIHRGKNQPPFKIDDFLMKFAEKQEQTEEEMKTILNML